MPDPVTSTYTTDDTDAQAGRSGSVTGPWTEAVTDYTHGVFGANGGYRFVLPLEQNAEGLAIHQPRIVTATLRLEIAAADPINATTVDQRVQSVNFFLVPDPAAAPYSTATLPFTRGELGPWIMGATADWHMHFHDPSNLANSLLTRQRDADGWLYEQYYRRYPDWLWNGVGNRWGYPTQDGTSGLLDFPLDTEILNALISKSNWNGTINISVIWSAQNFTLGWGHVGATLAPPTLILTTIPCDTGWVGAVPGKGRAIHSMRSGFPAQADDLVEDGDMDGVWVLPWERDDDDPYETDTYVPSPSEGARDDDVPV